MNKKLIDTAIRKIGVSRFEELLFSDYKDIDPNVTVEDVNFSKVRGSIRLSQGRILFPLEINKMRQSVLESSFR